MHSIIFILFTQRKELILVLLLSSTLHCFSSISNNNWHDSNNRNDPIYVSITTILRIFVDSIVLAVLNQTMKRKHNTQGGYCFQSKLQRTISANRFFYCGQRSYLHCIVYTARGRKRSTNN